MPFDNFGKSGIPLLVGPRAILHCGDAAESMRNISANTVDAIITSPPYAQQRYEQYGGVPEREYPEWTAEWMEAARPLLKPNGSVAIVIRPHVRHGTVSDYVLRTILLLRERGWKHHDDFVWHKPSVAPKGRIDWPRRSYEMIHWFGLGERPFCDPHANGAESDHVGVRKPGKKDLEDWCESRPGAVRSAIACSKDVSTVGAQDCARGRKSPGEISAPLGGASRWVAVARGRANAGTLRRLRHDRRG